MRIIIVFEAQRANEKEAVEKNNLNLLFLKVEKRCWQLQECL